MISTEEVVCTRVIDPHEEDAWPIVPKALVDIYSWSSHLPLFQARLKIPVWTTFKSPESRPTRLAKGKINLMTQGTCCHVAAACMRLG
jgi:hypothetical protein